MEKNKEIIEDKKEPISTTVSQIRSLYKIISDPSNPEKWCVKLLSGSGDWEGIVYSYGEFNLQEPKTEEDEPKFKFETDIIHVPERLRGVTFPDEKELEIQILLGKILFDILDQYKDKAKVVNNKLVLEIENVNKS